MENLTLSNPTNHKTLIEVKLIPFNGSSPFQQITVHVSLTQIAQNRVLAQFVVTDPKLSSIFPSPIDPPMRQDELWKTTCLEVFVGQTDSKEYSEINVSPNGNWNVYSFKDYRIGMKPSDSFSIQMKNDSRSEPNFLRSIEISSLENHFFEQKNLIFGLTAVIQLKDGPIDYYSIRHPGSQPDFHNQDGWTPCN